MLFRSRPERRCRRRRCGHSSGISRFIAGATGRRTVSFRVHRTERGRVPTLPFHSSMRGKERELQRRPAPTPQAGDSVWTKGPSLWGGSATEGTSGAAERILLRGRVREAALLETKRKRVSGAIRPTQVGSVAGWIRTIESASLAEEISSPRHGVSENSGLGQSSRRAQSRRGELGTDARAKVIPAPDP